MNRNRIWDFLASVSKDFSLEVFDGLGLQKMIEESLNEADAWEKKKCPLGARIVVVLALLMNLSRTKAIFEVFKDLIDSLRSKRERLPLLALSEEAVYHARGRVGSAPLRLLFEKTTEIVDIRPTFHDMRVLAGDGVHFTLVDTEANAEAFGRMSGSNGEGAYPQMKGVTLTSVETHEVVGAAFGPCHMDEHASLWSLVDRLMQAQDMLIVDSGMPSFHLFDLVASKGAHFLARISGAWEPEVVQVLGPGDYLVRITARVEIPESECRQTNQTMRREYMEVRMLEYTFESTDEVIRLLTDLTDTRRYSALELARLYHERWEVEISYDELKTHLESIPHGGSKAIFRSHTPDGCFQEAWAMLAIYNLVRHTMAQAARTVSIDPRQISFVGSLNVIRRAIPRFAASTGELQTRRLFRQLLQDIADCKLPDRRMRWYPRVVRINVIRFPKKRPHHVGKHFDYYEEIRFVAGRKPRKAA